MLCSNKGYMFRNKYMIAVLSAILLISSALAWQTDVYGTEARADFAIRTLLPENQINRDRTFFDLQTTPGMEQVVHIMLYNNTSEAMTIEVLVTTATTNHHGIADYRQQPELHDDTLIYPMEDIIDVAEYVEIEPYSNYLLDIHIAMPELGYDGVIAGGISFRQQLEDVPVEGVRNTFAYLTAILLWQGDTQVVPEPVLRDVVGQQVGADVNVTANIQNSQSNFLHHMNLNVEILTLDGEEVLYEFRRSDMQMAPNSNFDYSLFVPRNTLVAESEYLLRLRIEGQGQRYWDFEQSFVVLPEEVHETPPRGPREIVIQEPPPVIEEPEVASFPWWIVGVVAGGLILSTALVLLLMHRRRMKEEDMILAQRRKVFMRMMYTE